MCGCALFLLPLGFLHHSEATVAIGKSFSVRKLINTACICIAIACLGLVSCGSMKSATMVARQYSHFVMSIVQVRRETHIGREIERYRERESERHIKFQFVVCIAMLAIPFIVSFLAPNNTIEEWRSIFFFVSAILFITNLFFCYLCDSEAAPWTVEKFINTKNLPLLSDDPQATVATIAEHI